MSIVNFFIYMYIILKPFYIFSSGSVQISDIMLIISFILLLISKEKKNIKKYINSNIYFVMFSIFVLIINLSYYIIFNNDKFIVSILYYIFNLIAIIMFSYSFSHKNITKKILKVLKINLIIQVLIYLFHQGRYYGFTRYMGTFNDPNQFAFFVFISTTFIFILVEKFNYKKRVKYIYFSISLFLIIESASTGMLAGMIMLLLVDYFRTIKLNTKKIVITILATMLILGFLLVNISKIITIYNESDNYLITRIRDKFDRIDNTSNSPSHFEERGYDKIVNNPQYILIGAGEGSYERFNGYNNLEIHATFPGILFYYGIFPFFLLFKWIYKNLKNNEIKNIVYLLPLFVESFTLLNQRQSLFWGIIVLFNYIKIEEVNTAKEENNEITIDNNTML